MIVKDHDAIATLQIVIGGRYPTFISYCELNNIYSSRNGSRWDSSSARSDSESGKIEIIAYEALVFQNKYFDNASLDVPKKSLKSRLGTPKKKNERTGITITLSRSKEEKRSDRRRKRSYDAESDTSEVSFKVQSPQLKTIVNS